MADDNKLNEKQNQFINDFNKYNYISNDDPDDDESFQLAHKFMWNFLTDKKIKKKELLEILPKLKSNGDLYDILVDDFLYLDEFGENGEQWNKFNIKNKSDTWIVGSA